MLQTISNFLSSHGGVIASIVSVLMIVNAVLSALSAGLDKLKDVIPSDTDNKILAIVNKVAAVVQKVLDFLSANRAH
jgi:hypothetical protein